MHRCHITAWSFLVWLIVTLAGCGQTPLMNVGASHDAQQGSSTETSTNTQIQQSEVSRAVIPSFVTEFEEIQTTCNDRNRSELEELERQYKLATTDDELKLLVKQARELQAQSDILNAPLLPQALALVEPHAADNAAVVPLIWIAHQGYKSTVGEDAAALLIEHHLTNKKTTEFAASRCRSGIGWVEPMLRRQVAAPGLPDELRPRQMLALAHAIRAQLDDLPEDAEKLDEAIQLYTELQRTYSEREYKPGCTFGDLAESALFEIENLKIGKSVPELEGEDLNGKSLKLSDFRGKVVMLSFWASWCGPCMDLVPHERELVKRYQGRPFVLLGVNADLDKEFLKLILEKEQITWRSFWCGEEGPGGPIPMKWNVLTWPTVFVIDHRGVMKKKRLDDDLIEQLVVEAEQTSN